MGYDVHITRAEHWADNSGHEILDYEWLEIIDQDKELVPSPENGKYFVIWRGTNKYSETWFNWENGNISTKCPDRATIYKILQIAQKLNAQIQGDDGEVYGEEQVDNFDDSYLDNKPATSNSKKSNIGIYSKIVGFLKRI